MGLLPFSIVDVFAEAKYAGNELAVVRQAASLSGPEMQKIAREMNFSETTFILKDEASGGGFDVRIFTPRSEMPFAGHPTLGTAFVIQQEILRRQVGEVVLNLKVGPIPVTFTYRGGEPDVLWMRQIPPGFGQTITAGAGGPGARAQARGHRPAVPGPERFDRRAVFHRSPEDRGGPAAQPGRSAKALRPDQPDRGQGFSPVLPRDAEPARITSRSGFLPTPWASPRTRRQEAPTAAWPGISSSTGTSAGLRSISGWNKGMRWAVRRFSCSKPGRRAMPCLSLSAAG